MNIGEFHRIVTVEPAVLPVPLPQPAAVPVPTLPAQVTEPVEVPA